MPRAEMFVAVANQIAVVPVQFISFWLSVSLPVAYIPLLYGGRELTLLVALLAIHVVALMLGHGYGSDETGHSDS